MTANLSRPTVSKEVPSVSNRCLRNGANMFSKRIKRGVLGTVLLGGLVAGGTGCSTHAGTGGLIGGAIGAGTGAIIGHNSHRRSAEGALIGGAVGALAGAAIGDAKDRSERDRYYD